MPGAVALVLGAVALAVAMAIDIRLGDPDVGIPMSAWPLVLYGLGVLGIGCALYRTPRWSVQTWMALGVVLIGVLADVVYVVGHVAATFGGPPGEVALALVGIAYVVSMAALWMTLAAVLLRGTRLEALVVPLVVVATVDVAWAVVEAALGDPMSGLASFVAAWAVVSFGIAVVSIADALDMSASPGMSDERAKSGSDT